MDDLSSELASLKIDRTPPREQGSGLLRWLVVLLALAALAGAAAWVYPRLEAQFFKTDVKTSTIVEVSPSLALTSLTATGYVIAEQRSKVGSNVTGRIATLHVHEGSQVKQGDLLIELDAADQKSAMMTAQARLFAAQAKVATSRAALRELNVQIERQRALVTQNAAARSVVEDLEARIFTAEAQIQSALAEARTNEAEVQLSRVTLGRMTIHAPISGTVLDKPLDVGETVNPQTPLMEIADLSSLVVEIDVPEGRLSLIKVGGPCEISLDAFAGKRIRGKVHEIGKRVNRSKATLPVKVAFTDEAAYVLPDMSARVSFLTEALDAAALAKASKLVVPAKAITDRDGQKGVFVVEGGVLRLTPVQLGAKSGDGYELLDGPLAGTRVVLNPAATLASGLRVKEGTE